MGQFSVQGNSSHLCSCGNVTGSRWAKLIKATPEQLERGQDFYLIYLTGFYDSNVLKVARKRNLADRTYHCYFCRHTLHPNSSHASLPCGHICGIDQASLHITDAAGCYQTNHIGMAWVYRKR
jgi:hypothetical protein